MRDKTLVRKLTEIDIKKKEIKKLIRDIYRGTDKQIVLSDFTIESNIHVMKGIEHIAQALQAELIVEPFKHAGSRYTFRHKVNNEYFSLDTDIIKGAKPIGYKLVTKEVLEEL